MALSGFHPLIQRWFASRFAAPTEPQEAGWPHIAAGEHTLIAAPTGSGKTLTAFLAVIDRLLKESIDGRLEDGMRVVYVSPLRALSNDMHRNLSVPLEELNALAAAEFPDVPMAAVRVGLRTGDTTASKRAALTRKPPHILVTTPESLFLLLTADRGREALKTVDTVIVDEIHALVRDKRGSHLTLTIERLEALCGRPLQRIGLSATQKPIERVARFLVGCPGEDTEAGPACSVVDVGHSRELDLGIETPPSELSAVCSMEQWGEINQRIIELIESHRSTLIFVNTRRMAERVTHQLTGLLGEEHVASHHGSLASGHRLRTEQRLKDGLLKAVVATASLELGLDVGCIDLVIQIGSPRSIATFLQRIGRSGHSLGKTPKGRLFALTRDELIECMALIRAVRGGRLDVVPIPEAPVDVLAQQVVAEVACREWATDDLFALCRRAWPFRELKRSAFDETLRFLSEGLTDRSGRGRVYLHHDQVQRRVRTRPGARIAAASNAGAIPDVAEFRVVAQPEQTVVGTLDEDFAVESHAGQIVLLGNTSWRIEGVRGTDVHVTDAGGAPPTIPFWRGEAPGRTVELSEEVSRLREEVEADLRAVGTDVCSRFPHPGPLPGGEGDTGSAGGTRGRSTVGQAGIGTRLGGPEASTSPHPGPLPGGEGDTGRASGTRGRSTDGQADGGTRLGGPGTSMPPHPDPLPGGEGDTGRASGTRRDVEGMGTPPHPGPLPGGEGGIVARLVRETSCSEHGARQVVDYVAAEMAAVGLVPTQRRVIFERFFDETGGMQLVVHAPFGSRINQAWGLAMRKRFCRSFDFELQATADDDGFILSLGPQHSFPIESLFSMMTRANARGLLEQAILYVPMFQIRWRWNANRALLVLKRDKGKKIPPALQRFRSDDLLTSVFPLLTGCQENVVGELEMPDHILVQQTMHDCLHEALDLDGLHRVMEQIEAGEIEFIARDTREPSPFSYELLNSNPYAFLDGGEIAERRARAVSTRRSLTVESVSDLGRLDPAAIAQVVGEAEPQVRSADELHDVLLGRIVVPESELAGYDAWLEELAGTGRAGCLHVSDARQFWTAAERLPAARAMFPRCPLEPDLTVPESVRQDWSDVDARVAAMRGLLETCGPITHLEAAQRTGMTDPQAFAALEGLEGEGVVLRGRFRSGGFLPDGGAGNEGVPGHEGGRQGLRRPLTPALSRGERGEPAEVVTHAGEALPDKPAVAHGDAMARDDVVEWCHRRLLARIHRLTMEGLRKQIQPVGSDVFVRFLTHHHGVTANTRRAGVSGLYEAVSMLQGLDLPAVAWERDLLTARVDGYRREWLDELCLNGEVGWGRLYPPKRGTSPAAGVSRVVPLSVFLREDLVWLLASRNGDDEIPLSESAGTVAAAIGRMGAAFAMDLARETGLSRDDLMSALSELVALGLVTADGFGGLRALTLIPEETLATRMRSPGLPVQRASAGGAGRWSLWTPRGTLVQAGGAEAGTQVPVGPEASVKAGETDSRRSSGELVEWWAWQLLRRWGVMFRDLLDREPGAPPWWQLLQVYRRLEARGELRGGRFVSGVAGEQFALPDTVRRLRQLRDETAPPDAAGESTTARLRAGFLKSMRDDRAGAAFTKQPPDELVALNAADPLNLTGVISGEVRVPAMAHNRVVLHNGKAVAALINGAVETLVPVAARIRERIQRELGMSASPDTDDAIHRDESEPDRDAPPRDTPPPPGTPDSGRGIPSRTRAIRPVIS